MELLSYKSKYHKFLFVFEFEWSILDKIKKIQKLHGWQKISYLDDGVKKGWAFSDVAVGQVIEREFLASQDAAYAIEMSQEKKRLAGRDKETTVDQESLLEENLTAIEVPTLVPLFDFQRKTVDFIKKMNGKALLALDMGLGKSAVAIGYGLLERLQRVLVVCPASVKENWKREIKKFAGIKANILSDEAHGGWEIINYEQLKNFEDYLLREPYDLVIFDESHFIKNKQAQRTKFSVKLAKKTGKVLFLTGTPVLNKPIEVYNVLNIVSPTGYWEFCMRYCGAKKTQWGWDLGGASHLDELRRKMYFMIRRTKEQVLSELPDKTVSVLDTSISPEGKKEYRKIQKEFREWLIENGKNINALYAEALTKVGYLKQVVVRHKNIEEIIENFLESGKKIIVFSQYVEIIERLSKQYVQESVALTGATPTKDRQGIIDEFQNNPEKRIFLSTLKAGGVGITLTAADTVLFTDLDWVPANHLQAEDRAHRIGQKNNVNVYYLITPDTIEEEIWKLLRRKEKVVNQILDGKEDVRRVHITSLLKKI